MLILSRKTDESIIINENIEITIIGISEGKVKVGIKAPKDVEILRSEVKKAVESENKVAIDNINISALKNLLKK